MPSIEAKYFLKLPHFQVPREIDLQDNFKAIERWANTLTLPDPAVAVPGVGSGLSQIAGVPPTLFVNVDGSSLVIVGNALRVNTNGITLAHMAPGSVGSDEIINGSVGTAELGIGAVDTPNIQADAVTGVELADGSVANAHLANNAVVGGLGGKILDGSITASDIGLSQIVASLINTGAVTFIKTSSDWPTFYTSRGAAIIGNGTTPIPMTSESYDIGNWHSSGSSSFFVPEGGNYIFSGYIEWQGLASGATQAAEIVINGARLAYQGATLGALNTNISCVTAIFRCNAGAQIQLRGFQNTGGNVGINAAAFGGCAFSK